MRDTRRRRLHSLRPKHFGRVPSTSRLLLLGAMKDKINLDANLATFSESFQPRTVAQLTV